MLRNRSLPLLAMLVSGALCGQTPAAPVFEVATIRPAAPLDPAKVAAGQLHVGLKTDAGRVDIGFFSLSDLIRTAYRIKPYQLSGPDWLSADRWDIVAKIPEGAAADQVPEMLQALLADRFKLAVHRSNTDHPIYALVVAKNGPKMKGAEPDPPPAAAPEGQPAGPPGRGGMVFGSGDNQVRVTQSSGGRGATISSGKFGQMKIETGEAGAMRMEFSKMKMSDLADMLSPFADRPVLDMTELNGAYQVALDLSMEDLMKVAKSAGLGMMMGGAPGAEAPLPPTSSIFTAVQQLGLKLEPRKAPVEMIVVDHVEKTPTEN